jgi:hypothetical protein
MVCKLEDGDLPKMKNQKLKTKMTDRNAKYQTIITETVSFLAIIKDCGGAV